MAANTIGEVQPHHWLLWAAENGDLTMVQTLSEQHPSLIDENNSYAGLTFYVAAKHRQFHIVQWLYEKNPKLNIRNPVYNDQYSAFHAALSNGDFDMTKWLCERNPEWIKMRDTCGRSILVIALYAKHFEMMQWLYELDHTLIQAVDHSGRSLLHIAALASCDDHLQIFKWIYERNPMLTDVCDIDGANPLHYAAISRAQSNYDIVKFLSEQNPMFIRVCDNDGKTPLDIAYAFQPQNSSIIKLLLSKQPIFMRDKNYEDLISSVGLPSEFPLHFAARSGNLDDVQRVLNDDPTRIFQKDIWNRLPLHHAVECNQLNVTRFLLEKDPSMKIDADDCEGKSAYDLSYEFGDENLRNLFEQELIYCVSSII